MTSDTLKVRLTPRMIVCPNCHAPMGVVCLTYVEPDVASDLAVRVPLYCAQRIDAAFVKLAEHMIAECMTRSAK